MTNEAVDSIRAAALDAIRGASDGAALDRVRVEYLGRKGKVKALLARIGQLPADERPAYGDEINRLKADLAAALSGQRESLAQAALRRDEIRAAV
ncbi:MAG: phenylalanine--tRNA ligase subunit alpha, partial [Gammaproteobacteria bacterium]|nr:phenylalanine--tRNA ligase subunit alpha [Gammaproteobacteria bacterium]